MKYNELLGKTFACPACQKEHSVNTKALIYADDAMGRLGEFVEANEHKDTIAIIADTRTFQVVGKEVEKALSAKLSSQVFSHIIPDKGDLSPSCDDVTKEALLNSLPKADLMIAVGSGVVSDLTKWVAFERGVPYYTVATAASMNGYASANVAASVKGVKVLIEATAPLAVFAEPKIIENAPYELTSSGLGDAMAKPVSSADWKLNHLFINEYFCQFVVDIISELEPVYLNHPEKIKNRDPKALKALFEALFYSGIAMTVAGTSAPASGGEHLLSHSLDMLAHRDHKESDLHGRQVGLGTILSAALYEKIFSLDSIEWKSLPEDIDSAFWGNLSKEVGKHYQAKLAKTKDLAKILNQPGKWSSIRDEVKKILRPPQVIKDCLSQAGAAHKIQDICDYDVEMFTKTWIKSHEMRSRFTILDLAFMAGVMPGQAGEIVRKWVL